jgi:hypothetical protein
MLVRTRLLSAVAALALAAVILVAPPVSAHHRAGPCDADRQSDETIQHFMKRKIRCAVDLFGPVPGGADRAICIADRESGLIPTASSPTGLYLGLFQHSAAAWPDRYAKWTDPPWELSSDALSGRTNAIVTIRMVHATGTWKAAGWPSDAC